MRFTEEELEAAKRVDLCAVAESLGYTVKRIGKYHTLKEMDSIRIYGRSHWYRWSRANEKGNNGGSQIDFLRVFAGMDVKEAVFWLLDFAGYSRNREDITEDHIRSKRAGQKSLLLQTRAEKQEDRKAFVLPDFAGSNVHIINYLQNERGISRAVIDRFIHQGSLYEEKSHHNAVFVGKDISGTPKFASMRGIYDRKGRPFKCDVAGNDKNYGFCDRVEGSDQVLVFEAAIDLMSCQTLFPEGRANMLALGMLHDAPLETMLREQPEIGRITFCLDNDARGREAADRLMEKYYGLGYEVEDFPADRRYKDFNEWLVGSIKAEKGKTLIFPDKSYEGRKKIL